MSVFKNEEESTEDDYLIYCVNNIWFQFYGKVVEKNYWWANGKGTAIYPGGYKYTGVTWEPDEIKTVTDLEGNVYHYSINGIDPQNGKGRFIDEEGLIFDGEWVD